MKKVLMRCFILSICSIIIAIVSVQIMRNNAYNMPDMLEDNVEALSWKEQIIVGALCGWTPDLQCKYKLDTGEVYYLEGILVPWS